MTIVRGVKSRLRRWTNRRPNITRPSGSLPVGAGAHTFVLICGALFDQDVPNATTTYRMGLCRGFEQLGIPYRIVSVFDLERELAEIPKAICFMSGTDYQYLSNSDLAALAKQRHFVWIGPWFRGDRRFYEDHGLENLTDPNWLRRRVLSSSPDFVFTPVTESGHRYYAEWTRNGATLISLPLACDTTKYRVDANAASEFRDVDVAFVGGYWPYKAIQFDRYLKPYEKRLTVFGYSRWPYAGYGGQISEQKEPLLLNQARLCPAINEPHAEVIGGDICERVYKVLGSGGMCVTDATAAHRDIFAADELLVPRDLDHFHQLVRDVLNDDDLCAAYRARGHQAVMSRHTYVHRAQRILEELGQRAS